MKLFGAGVAKIASSLALLFLTVSFNGPVGARSAIAQSGTPPAQASTQPGVKLPIELIGFNSIIVEFRSRIGLKFKDLRQNYSVHELAPGEIEFQNAQGLRVAFLTLDRGISGSGANGGLMKRYERVKIVDANNTLLLEEKIETEGTNLNFTRGDERLFFLGDGSYDLQPNETAKTILISADSSPVFRFNLRRSLVPNDPDLGTEIRYDIKIGTTEIMTIAKYDTGPIAKLPRTKLDYQTYGYGYSVQALGYRVSTGGSSISTPNFYNVTATHHPNYFADTYRFFKNSQEIYGMVNFLIDFNQTIYQQIVLQGVVAITENMLVPILPFTTRLQNLAAGGRFLDDLIILRSLVDQAKVNPTQLTQVTGIINQFITALQDSTLTVTDNRPKK